MSAARITVEGPEPYDVVIGRGVIAHVPALLKPGARTVLLVHSSAVTHVAAAAQDTLRRAGLQVAGAVVPDGESGKSLETAAELWSRLGQEGIGRADAVVAVGGGATTDVAGFVAATWLRGVQWACLPTTLLGMVDAGIGGKTAVNTAAGKNLVGAFHPPVGVLCDLDVLSTLPLVEMASGLAEVAKVGFVADPDILDLLEAGLDDLKGSRSTLTELIERSVRVKAQVVSRDLKETGPREVLNYGHTLGHAIEKVEAFRWRHGAAISVGLIYAAELAHAVGRLDLNAVRRHRTVLKSLGLPTTYDGSRWPNLLEAMRMDKKVRGSALRFVVLDGIGRPGTLEGPDDELLRRAFERVAT